MNTPIKTVVSSDIPALDGKEVEIEDSKIMVCPGCGSHGVNVLMFEEDGWKLAHVGIHNKPPLVGNTAVMCEWSLERLVVHS